MARVTYVKSAQQRTNKDGSLKPNLTCNTCRREIKPGESYSWVALRIGRSSIRKNWCSEHRARPSDLTTSDKLSRLYSIQENVEDAQDKDALGQALADGATEAQEVADEYNESADNIEEGFGHETYQSEEIREKASGVEDWVSTLEQAADEIEGLEASDAVAAGHVDRSEIEGDNEQEEDESDEDYEERIDKLVEEAADEALLDMAREIADNAVGELSI